MKFLLLSVVEELVKIYIKKEGLPLRLSKEQRNFIRDNYSNMKNEDICNKLNITNKQLHGYANNLKLTKNYKYSKSFNNIYDKILEDRKEDYDVNNYINKKEEPKIDNSLLYKSELLAVIFVPLYLQLSNTNVHVSKKDVSPVNALSLPAGWNNKIPAQAQSPPSGEFS